jgi:hypothetical protein
MMAKLTSLDINSTCQTFLHKRSCAYPSHSKRSEPTYCYQTTHKHKKYYPYITQCAYKISFTMFDLWFLQQQHWDVTSCSFREVHQHSSKTSASFCWTRWQSCLRKQYSSYGVLFVTNGEQVRLLTNACTVKDFCTCWA